MAADAPPPDRHAPWPALMDLATAAAYLQVSSASARRLFRRLEVQPLALGLRLRRWRRTDLDALLDRLGGGVCAEDGAAARALCAVEARSRRGKPPPGASEPL